jgi:uncharacterized membrane protein YgcG
MTSASSPSGHDDGSFAQEARTQTLKAVILIVVAVLVAVLLLHRQPSSSTTVATKPKAPVTTAPVPTTPTTTPVTIPPAQVKVLVLNGTLKGSLAGDLSTKLKASPGYNTLIPDNTTTAVTTSTVYAVTSQYTAEAQAIASQLGLPASQVVTNLPANVPIARAEQTEANVIVVIGPDLAPKVSGTSSSSSSSGSSSSGSSSSGSSSSGSSSSGSTGSSSSSGSTTTTTRG